MEIETVSSKTDTALNLE